MKIEKIIIQSTPNRQYFLQLSKKRRYRFVSRTSGRASTRTFRKLFQIHRMPLGLTANWCFVCSHMMPNPAVWTTPPQSSKLSEMLSLGGIHLLTFASLKSAPYGTLTIALISDSSNWSSVMNRSATTSLVLQQNKDYRSLSSKVRTYFAK